MCVWFHSFVIDEAQLIVTNNQRNTHSNCVRLEGEKRILRLTELRIIFAKAYKSQYLLNETNKSKCYRNERGEHLWSSFFLSLHFSVLFSLPKDLLANHIKFHRCIIILCIMATYGSFVNVMHSTFQCVQ